MSVSLLIQKIIENFQAQEQIYHTIADLAARQVDLLAGEDWINKPEHLNDLLKKRQQMAWVIDRLNNDNQLIQAEVKQLLGIDDFVLSRLKSRLNEEDYKSLQHTLARLGDLLGDINKMDEQSHSLLKDKAAINRSLHSPDSKKVQNAYQEAMRQGHSSPRRN
ncbi:Uncharacterized [Syntrophomonas zehnderi OL-4]|uniref:Uncharacterized n=1 Tax=Syntrophomonas zehnderi OL-4 TaxID=690567 RepID=A0A0E4GTX7_9FIRM|nr:hypothetical protein [Syntrophomonas zehnderi]CQB52003.1 Uncharacterized [Syntrophomonas zehnderi OL-4]